MILIMKIIYVSVFEGGNRQHAHEVFHLLLGFLGTGTGTDILWISTSKYRHYSKFPYKFSEKYQKFLS